MNSGDSRTLQLPLNFLAEGRQYTAHIYSDDESISTRTHVKIERVPVTRESVLEVMMSAQGGQALRIEPLAK
jgi:alpha-glucosidase